MDPVELRVAMVRNNNATVCDMADVIKKSRVSFNKKRFGEVPFNVDEVLALSKALSLTLQDVNLIFFDSELRDGKMPAAASAKYSIAQGEEPCAV